MNTGHLYHITTLFSRRTQRKDEITAMPERTNLLRLLRFFMIGIFAAFLISAFICFILPVLLILMLLYALFAPQRLRSSAFHFRNFKNFSNFRNGTAHGGTPPNYTADDDVIDVEAKVVNSSPVERLEDRRN